MSHMNFARRDSVESIDINNVIDQPSMEVDCDGLKLVQSFTATSLFGDDEEITFQPRVGHLPSISSDSDNDTTIEIFNSAQNSPGSVCNSIDSEIQSEIEINLDSNSSVDLIAPSRPVSCNTVIEQPVCLKFGIDNQLNMAIPDAELQHINFCKRAALIWEDDYQGLDVESYGIAELDEAIAEAKVQAEGLRQAHLYFEAHQAQGFSDQDKNRLASLRKAFSTMLRSLKAAKKQPDPAVGISTRNINAMRPTLSSTVVQLVRDYKTVSKTVPQNTAGFKSMDAMMSAADKDAADVITQLNSLRLEATKANCGQVSAELVDELESLREAKRKARQHVKETQQKLGVLPGHSGGGGGGGPLVNVPAPQFSGDFGDGLDFFSFKTKLEEYFDGTGAYSESQKLVKLKNDCIKLPALNVINHLTDYSRAMSELEKLYGQARILFNIKQAEIKKLGACPETCMERRSWLIEMKSKLTHVHELAQSQNIQNRFDSCELLSVAERALRAIDEKEFMERLQCKQKLNPAIDYENRKQRMSELIEYFDILIENATWELKFRLGRGEKDNKEIMAAFKKPDKDVSKDKEKRKSYQSASIAAAFAAAAQNSASSDSDSDYEPVKQKPSVPQPGTSSNSAPRNVSSVGATNPKLVFCISCNRYHTTLEYCTKYQKSNSKDRFRLTAGTKSCPLCLRMDAEFAMDDREAWYKKHAATCDPKFVCTVDKCAEKPGHMQNHITLCGKHLDENKGREADLIESLNKKYVKKDAKFFFSDATLYSCLTARPSTPPPDHPFGKDVTVEPDVKEVAIYMLQYVPGPQKEKLLMFYDSGCFGAGLSDRGYSILDTTCMRPGPTRMDVAGGKVVTVPHGDERLYLDLDSEGGKRHLATITALRMPEISSEFPIWPLQEAFDEIQNSYQKEIGVQHALPTVEDSIGGMTVDILMGIKYIKYFPQPLYYLPSGLGIYKAAFKGYHGHQGVLGGPHASWTQALAVGQNLSPDAYLTAELRAHRHHSNTLFHSVKSHPDPEKHEALKHTVDDETDDVVEEILENGEIADYVSMPFFNVSHDLKRLMQIDELGGDVEYRCEDCRSCGKCKKSETLEKLSLAEEREQSLIERCIQYNPDEKQLSTKLPFVLEADSHIVDNYSVAKKVLESQVKIAHKHPETIEQIIASHDKLRNKGYVSRIQDLPESHRKFAEKPGYYLPWRAVYSSSLSTPCRMVFDASARCRTGYSLNCVLAKGTNMLATLFHLLIKFRVGASALTADISMAYNQIQLQPEFLMFHKYLWKEGLEKDAEVVQMVTNTLIYGVKSSGNITMTGFKMVAEEAAKEPELAATGGPECLSDSSYMDDILAAFLNDMKRDTAGEGLERTLDLGKMSVKAITKSGQLPDEKVSADGQNVSLVGYLWTPETDLIKLDIKPTVLTKAKRGKPPSPITDQLPEQLSSKLTRRVLAGRVASVFDPLGLATPFTAKLKVDLSAIIAATAGWDDVADSKYLDTWVKNLNDIQQLGGIQVARSLLTSEEDAENVDLVVATDASQYVAAAAAYLRVKLSDGSYKCLLMAAKSKIVSKLTIPRAELRACTLGACLGHVVKMNCKGLVKKVTFVSDSAVALSWMVTDTRPLQVGVRNQVVQIRRLTDLEDWYHVPSADNPADIATRGAAVCDIGAGSEWMIGKAWMHEELENSPLRKISEVVLQPADKSAVKAEIRNADVQGIMLTNNVDQISLRYAYSEYIVDPCGRSWTKFVRQVALIRRMGLAAAKKAEPLIILEGRPLAVLTEEDYAGAKQYIFKKTTKELIHFNKKEKLADGVITNEVMRYSGRIMDGTEIDDPMGIFPDLQPVNFTTPMIDRYSPVAYSIMIHAHVELTCHGGVRSTLRASRDVAFILQGKQLAAEVRQDCAYCQRYKVKQVEAVMGKIHQSKMTIAPAFYHSQVDLFGPITAYCVHGRRSTVKAYAAVFKCSSSLAVAAFTMDAYNTTSFLDAFTRFATRFGTPQKLFIDAGSQLVAACRQTEFSLTDVTATLNTEHLVKIEFETCPVGNHEAHGSVERSIRELKKVLHTTFHGIKMDLLKIETALAWACGQLNSLPMCLGNAYTDLEHLDLITPARLLNGRNNGRNLSAWPEFHQPGEVVNHIAEMEKAWWNVWKEEKIANLIPQAQKWRKGEPDLAVGDIVVFLRDQSQLSGLSWRVGEVSAVEESKDGVVRRVEIKYKNSNENVFRFTKRSVRDVGKLWREGELDLAGQLSAAQRAANVAAHIAFSRA